MDLYINTYVDFKPKGAQGHELEVVIRFPDESEYALGYGGDRLIFLTMGR